MAWRDEKKCDKWTFHICRSIHRMSEENTIQDVIRINSQSGKGGVNYILNAQPRNQSSKGNA